MITTYDICKYIRRRFTLTMAELVTYNWGDDFKANRYKELVSSIKEQKDYFDVDPNDLTEEQMEELDFMIWEGKTRCVPFYLYNFLIPSIEVDNDHRMGMLFCDPKGNF